MRLVDLLLVLLFEGRRALPKSCVSIPKGGISGLRRFDSSNERSHRQLIDCIRSKDTDAVIDAIENGEIFKLKWLHLLGYCNVCVVGQLFCSLGQNDFKLD